MSPSPGCYQQKVKLVRNFGQSRPEGSSCLWSPPSDNYRHTIVSIEFKFSPLQVHSARFTCAADTDNIFGVEKGWNICDEIVGFYGMRRWDNISPVWFWEITKTHISRAASLKCGSVIYHPTTLLTPMCLAFWSTLLFLMSQFSLIHLCDWERVWNQITFYVS